MVERLGFELPPDALDQFRRWSKALTIDGFVLGDVFGQAAVPEPVSFGTVFWAPHGDKVPGGRRRVGQCIAIVVDLEHVAFTCWEAGPPCYCGLDRLGVRNGDAAGALAWAGEPDRDVVILRRNGATPGRGVVGVPSVALDRFEYAMTQHRAMLPVSTLARLHDAADGYT